MKPYVPIACADHERLEYAALKREWLFVCLDDGDRVERHRVLPLDVFTRDAAEWLVAQTTSGSTWTVRLDAVRIDEAQ